MHPFPFSVDEWELVSETSLHVVNATLANDDVLRASYFVDLQHVLAEMRSRHGEHPVLIETEADFMDDSGERDVLYKRAIALAEAHGLPTLSIRVSLARMLLEDLGQPLAARLELLKCRNELEREGDDYVRRSWSELLAQCETYAAN